MFRYSESFINSALYVASFFKGHFPFFLFLLIGYLYQLLGGIIFIVIIIMVFMSPVTVFFTPVPLLYKPSAIPTSQGSSFSLQYFQYYV
jgi:hypothetical protein